ncbi:hypothetical protein T440DRAFT_514478 [Plenodomus tracheiphilus IPT5]|uniref:Uncharacterized protein n=1 Tax=Plenodomus tracheiphilus IPT5 TaxID=1408161 RepID=A0A6A7BJI8_9PLEO|nr:hypothetical protein T440DRAFT_514478 [Plenodomus tracheiphilus IPT5]
MPSSTNKRQLSPKSQTIATNISASRGKKRMMGADRAKQHTMSSEEGLALLEQAVQKYEDHMASMHKLAVIAKKGSEEVRRDSAMDTRGLSTEGVDDVTRNVKVDREASAKEAEVEAEDRAGDGDTNERVIGK